MGAGNVKLVYARWYGLPDLPFRVLAYMALVSLDGDREPAYWGGWESLALAAGRLVPPRNDDDPDVVRVRRAALKAVNGTLRLLVGRGALRVKVPAAPGRNTTYGLTLSTRTVHGGREPNGAPSPGTVPDPSSTPAGGDGARSADTTVHGEPTDGSRSADVTVHAHRAPEEYEEQEKTQPRSDEGNLRTAVTGSRARQADEEPDSVDEVEEPAGCRRHGRAFAAGLRPDGKPACPLCRRGAPASTPTDRIAPVIPITRNRLTEETA